MFRSATIMSCLLSLALSSSLRGAQASKDRKDGSDFYPGALTIMPEDGRGLFLEAFAMAKKEIRIEICVLEDPQILQGLNDALSRGVTVRVIADNHMYHVLSSERENLAKYFTSAGGILHLSNPIVPKSFPKVVLIDDRFVMVGTACLDTATFEGRRDYAHVSDDSKIISDLLALFENDWLYSSPPGGEFPKFNPTPAISQASLLISPTNAMERLVGLLQQARKTLDATSEELGNPTISSELIAAALRGVQVRLIAPLLINGASQELQAQHNQTLALLSSNGINVRVTLNPQTATNPYMHARSAIIDERIVYLGSISFSVNSSTFNREVGLSLKQKSVLKKVKERFACDFANSAMYPLTP
eukprot:g9867.t1